MYKIEGRLMECRYFGVCGSCTLYDLDYEAQIEHKKSFIASLFKPLHVEHFEMFTSASEHYRSRAEFRIWHDKEKISYAMGRADKKGAVCIEHCPKVVERIDTLMPTFIAFIALHAELKERLFAIEFLSSSKDLLVTLIYHKPLTSEWDNYALLLEKEFGISVMGRSHKVKRILSQDFVEENLTINGLTYRYHILEGGFSQPNCTMNEKMISWVCSHIHDTKDLLELYCGHGNFTIPMSKKFTKVLATEISKTSIKSALTNCELNDVRNIEFLRMSAEELTSALKKEREFNRLQEIDLDAYHFSHVFVDPPRSGMDEESLAFISQFETIIYISCNPLTLKRDLDILSQTYAIQHFALFDQFPNTEHLESGVILKKI